MADGALSSQAARRLLDGVDTAFEQALHGRYGGGVQAILIGGVASDLCQDLRVSAAGLDDCLQLFLQPQGTTALPAMGHGVVVGTVSFGQPGQIVTDVAIKSEIFDTRDPNEAADASALATGVLFVARQDGGLVVSRSSEAAAAGGRQARRQQRGWLPRQQRHNHGRALGLSNAGHRRALPSGLSLPVTAELLTRLGGAVAGMNTDGQAPAIGRVTLVIQAAMEAMA